MAKIKYQYNSETCKYEPVFVSTKELGRKTAVFIGISFMLGIAGLIYFNIQFPLLDEAIQMEKNKKLKTEWRVLEKQFENTSNQLSALEKNDDENLRMILNLDPLSHSQREAGVGGREKESASITFPQIKTVFEQSEKIENRLEIEIQSMEELTKQFEAKEKRWAARPAIQPIDNRQLTRFNPIFGLRLHPIYHDWRNHNGLDLTAPLGTPVYATGDGVVTMASWSGGYGNVIFLQHGFGFETRYGHLSKYNTYVGQKVKRGDLIGFVGSTGTSTNSHLHYEVLYQGKFTNPVNFLYRDIVQDEYNKIIKPGTKSSLLSTPNRLLN